MWRSEPQIPQAATFTSNSPGPGLLTGTSTISAPNAGFVFAIAFIFLAPPYWGENSALGKKALAPRPSPEIDSHASRFGPLPVCGFMNGAAEGAIPNGAAELRDT